MTPSPRPLIIVGLLTLGALYIYAGTKGPVFHFGTMGHASPLSTDHEEMIPVALAAKFEELRANGNSTCSVTFKNAVADGNAGDRLKGSCCSAMDLHRYAEQVGGLKKYADIPEIPSDPYDVDGALAKRLAAFYDTALTPEQQQAYDYAVANSDEKGPCCCKCWRWYVYGGLAKLLIQKYGFTGEQLTEVWNLSDGCGGNEEHHS